MNNRARFFAKKDLGGTWSVIDGVDEQIVRMRGVLLAGLGEELAEDMVKLLAMERGSSYLKERE